MDKIIRYNIAEYAIILIILSYSIGNHQPDYPSLLGIFAMLLLVWLNIRFLGVLIGILFQLVSVVFFIALVSEASEFTSVNWRFVELVGVGSILLAIIAACGTVLVYKYGNHLFKNLIGD
jgi:uncharacterized membrane protein